MLLLGSRPDCREVLERERCSWPAGEVSCVADEDLSICEAGQSFLFLLSLLLPLLVLLLWVSEADVAESSPDADESDVADVSSAVDNVAGAGGRLGDAGDGCFSLVAMIPSNTPTWGLMAAMKFW